MTVCNIGVAPNLHVVGSMSKWGRFSGMAKYIACLTSRTVVVSWTISACGSVENFDEGRLYLGKADNHHQQYFLGIPVFDSVETETDTDEAIQTGQATEIRIGYTKKNTKTGSKNFACDNWDIGNAAQNLPASRTSAHVWGVYAINTRTNQSNCTTGGPWASFKHAKTWLYPNRGIWYAGEPVSLEINRAQEIVFSKDIPCELYDKYYYIEAKPKKPFELFFPTKFIRQFEISEITGKSQMVTSAGLLPSVQNHDFDSQGEVCAQGALDWFLRILSSQQYRDFVQYFRLGHALTQINEGRAGAIATPQVRQTSDRSGIWDVAGRYGTTPMNALRLVFSWQHSEKPWKGAVTLGVGPREISCGASFFKDALQPHTPEGVTELLTLCTQWIDQVFRGDSENCGHLKVMRYDMPVVMIDQQNINRVTFMKDKELLLQQLLDGGLDDYAK